MTEIASRPDLVVSYEDDPQVVAEAAASDYALHVVPPTWRVSRWKLMMAFWGVISAMFYVVTGAAVGAQVGTISAIVGMILSVLVYGLINKVISDEASRLGLTVALFSRSMFGRAGAALATLIFAATAIYYFVFEGSIIGVALKAQFGGDLKIWYAVVCLFTIPLVMRGVAKWLDKFNGVLLPLYLGGMIIAVIWAAVKYHEGMGFLTSKGQPGLPLPGWLMAFVAFMGVWILMMYTMDFARLGKPEDRVFHGWVTFGFPFYIGVFVFSGVIGIYLANTVPLGSATGFGEAGAAIALVKLMGIWGVLLIAITQVRINTANLYLASGNLEAFVSRVAGANIRREVWVIVAAVISYLLMISGVVLTYVLKALAYQGVFVTAWVAIALVHIAYTRQQGKTIEFRPLRVPNANPGGLIAWAVSVAIGIYLIESGDLNPKLSALAPIITVVVAAVIYAIAMVFASESWFRIERSDDPATEIVGPEAESARIRCSSCGRSYIVAEMDRDPESGYEVVCLVCADARAGLG